MLKMSKMLKSPLFIAVSVTVILALVVLSFAPKQSSKVQNYKYKIDNVELSVYCLEGVQYFGTIHGNAKFLSPRFDDDGDLFLCSDPSNGVILK